MAKKIEDRILIGIPEGIEVGEPFDFNVEVKGIPPAKLGKEIYFTSSSDKLVITTNEKDPKVENNITIACTGVITEAEVKSTIEMLTKDENEVIGKADDITVISSPVVNEPMEEVKVTEEPISDEPVEEVKEESFELVSETTLDTVVNADTALGIDLTISEFQKTSTSNVQKTEVEDTLMPVNEPVAHETPSIPRHMF